MVHNNSIPSNNHVPDIQNAVVFSDKFIVDAELLEQNPPDSSILVDKIISAWQSAYATVIHYKGLFFFRATFKGDFEKSHPKSFKRFFQSIIDSPCFSGVELDCKFQRFLLVF